MTKINQAVQNALNAVEVCKHKILMFEYAIQGIGHNNDHLKSNISAIYAELFKKLNRAYEVLFMWGNVAPEESLREAKKHAFDKFLNERQSIMHYLDINLEHPNMYFTDEEEEFRKEIEKLRDD